MRGGNRRTQRQQDTRKAAKEEADFAKAAGASRLGQGAAAAQVAKTKAQQFNEYMSNGSQWKKDYDAQMKAKRKAVGYWDSSKGKRRYE